MLQLTRRICGGGGNKNRKRSAKKERTQRRVDQEEEKVESIVMDAAQTKEDSELNETRITLMLREQSKEQIERLIKTSVIWSKESLEIEEGMGKMLERLQNERPAKEEDSRTGPEEGRGYASFVQREVDGHDVFDETRGEGEGKGSGGTGEHEGRGRRRKRRREERRLREEREEERRAKEAREERRAQEAREERRAKEAPEEQRRAQEAPQELRRAKEAQDEGANAVVERKRQVRRRRLRESEKNKKEKLWPRGGDEEEGENVTREVCVKDEREETHQMHEENDVSSRHMTWWRKAR